MSQPLNFPARIYQILENESPEIVQWNSNGLSFRLVNHIRFEAEIIPKYFRHRKLSSVQRQLNVYGFRSISRGEHKRSFYHPLFKRGNWEVVKQMQRYVPTKGGQNPEFDGSNMENAASSCDPTENCGDFNTAVADLFGSAPLAVAVHPAAAVSAASAVPLSRAGVNKAPGIPSFTRSVSGGLQICTDDDVSDHHFANDFRPHAEVGHEETSVHVQPVDFSIPLRFRADHTASLPADSRAAVSKSAAESDQNARADWAVNDDMLSWAGMLFEPEEENLDFLWASASAPSCAGAPEMLKCDPEDAAVESGMPPPPAGVVRMQSGGNRDHAWSERYRSDSLDDVYALCAELC